MNKYNTQSRCHTTTEIVWPHPYPQLVERCGHIMILSPTTINISFVIEVIFQRDVPLVIRVGSVLTVVSLPAIIKIRLNTR